MTLKRKSVIRKGLWQGVARIWFIICEGRWFSKTVAFQEVQSETEGLKIGVIGLDRFRF